MDEHIFGAGLHPALFDEIVCRSTPTGIPDELDGPDRSNLPNPIFRQGSKIQRARKVAPPPFNPKASSLLQRTEDLGKRAEIPRHRTLPLGVYNGHNFNRFRHCDFLR